MNSKFTSLDTWAGSMLDTLSTIVDSSVHVPQQSRWSTTGMGIDLQWSNPWLLPVVYEPFWVAVKTVASDGTPWDSAINFPPVDVDINGATKAMRFTWALAGIERSRCNLEFDNDKLILSIKAESSTRGLGLEGSGTEEDAEANKWASLKKGIKSLTKGLRNEYDVPSTRYDVQAAEATWRNGLLVVEIPLREQAQPVKVEIK